MGDLGRRFAQCGLELHPLKTEWSTARMQIGEEITPKRASTFWALRLGHGCRRTDGQTFVNFTPAVSAKAGKAIRQEVRTGTCKIAATSP